MTRDRWSPNRLPSFDWMFEVVDRAPAGVTPVPLPAAYAPRRGVVVPSRDAQALFAYLMSLKQPALPGDETGSTVAATAPVATAAPGTAPAGAADAAKGKSLFTTNCSACHQTSGEGLPGAFPSLKGNAAVNAADPTLHIDTVLRGAHDVVIGGVSYSSAMPPFAAALNDADIADIINYERSSWGNHATPVTAKQVAAERAKGK